MSFWPGSCVKLVLSAMLGSGTCRRFQALSTSRVRTRLSRHNRCLQSVAKADRRPREKKKFYHQFSIVKYSYLPTDTFRKYVERHVTWSKLTLKFTGYCRQTSYTDSTVIHTLVPAVAWELQSQFAPVYMHFNIIF